jgi:hypothetical protein
MISPVIQLAHENPQWLPVLGACYEVALSTSNRFCGAWVCSHLGRWFPSLKTLVRYGILEKLDTSRGGRRTYYRMVDLEGVCRDMTGLGILRN